jgi:hypothetical protein
LVNKIKIPEIQDEELTPTVKSLLNAISQCVKIIDEQAKEIQKLRDEIARLKGNNTKPKIRPGKMNNDSKNRDSKNQNSSKRKKSRKNMIHESLLDMGFDISSGKINDILIKNKDPFHKEKELLLETGLEISTYFVTDDTGTRHEGQNGYCNHIGNEYFAYFTSTQSNKNTEPIMGII